MMPNQISINSMCIPCLLNIQKQINREQEYINLSERSLNNFEHTEKNWQERALKYCISFVGT